MADMFLNLDFSGGQSSGQAEQGNCKHRQFIKRRKYLERKGLLKQKQLAQKPPNKKKREQSNSWDHTNGQQDGLRNHSQKTPKSSINFFHPHQQGAPSRTVALGAPCSSGTLSVSVTPNHSHITTLTSNDTPPKYHRPTQQGILNGQISGAKKQSNPLLQLPSSSLLSEFESGIPSASLVPSYKIVAIDCEMVGTGPKGSFSALARCSIVSYHGDVVYDKYIKPANPVTDYRTRWSGIRREHLINAVPFAAAQKEILKILQGKTVIGHAIQNDYKALGYFHPNEMTRDTSKIPLLNRKAGFPEKEMASLKRLAKQLLHKDIQTGRGGHSSVEDAKTTMELYRVVEAEYERELASGRTH